MKFSRCFGEMIGSLDEVPHSVLDHLALCMCVMAARFGFSRTCRIHGSMG